MRAALAALHGGALPPGMPTLADFTDLIGLPQIRELEQRYA